MFLGHHTCELKNKRLTFPPAWKDSLRGIGYVTQGFERNLLIFTPATFKELYGNISSLNIADPTARLLIRMILGSAHPLQLDRGGGLPLPAQLMELAGLDEKAVIIGQGEYCEIWSTRGWEEQRATLNNVQENAHRFASLNLYMRRKHA